MLATRDMLCDQTLLESQYELANTKVVGEGTYGKVYKARHKTNGREVALKKMPMTVDIDADEECMPSTYLREIALLKAARHPNIVELIDVFMPPGRVWLVFEFIEMDLKKFMRSLSGGSRKGLSLELVQRLSLHLCRGIEYMHTKCDMVHRDLKPQNLLVTRQRTLKLADLGLARQECLGNRSAGRFTPEVVTVWYRAPELLLGSAVYCRTLDLWSIGCIVAEMAIGEPLFMGISELDTIFLIFRMLGTPTDATLPGLKTLPHFGEAKFPTWPARAWDVSLLEISRAWDASLLLGPNGVDLVASLLVYDRRKRMPARDAVLHSFFEGVEPMVQRQLCRTMTPVQDRTNALLAAETPEKQAAEPQSMAKATSKKTDVAKKRSLESSAFAPDQVEPSTKVSCLRR